MLIARSRYIFDLLRRSNVMTLPLVDSQGRFVKLIHLSDLAGIEEVPGERGFDEAVIMAGGEGLRLRPVTDTIPKPMVEIGGIPLLQRHDRTSHEVGNSSSVYCGQLPQPYY